MNPDEEHMGAHWDHVTPGQEDRFTWVSKTPTGECGKAGHQEVRWREAKGQRAVLSHRSQFKGPEESLWRFGPSGQERLKCL